MDNGLPNSGNNSQTPNQKNTPAPETPLPLTPAPSQAQSVVPPQLNLAPTNQPVPPLQNQPATPMNMPPAAQSLNLQPVTSPNLPQAAPQAQPGPAVEPPAKSPHQVAEPTPEKTQEFKNKVIETRIINVLRVLISGGLTLIGFKGLYDSLYFIFVEFKQFESALILHELSRGQINVLILKVGLMLFSTAMSLFFALQIALFHHSKLFKWLKIIAGIVVMIISALVMMYASQIDASALLDKLPTFQFSF